jgi:hypothetical protein
MESMTFQNHDIQYELQGIEAERHLWRGTMFKLAIMACLTLFGLFSGTSCDAQALSREQKDQITSMLEEMQSRIDKKLADTSREQRDQIISMLEEMQSRIDKKIADAAAKQRGPKTPPIEPVPPTARAQPVPVTITVRHVHLVKHVHDVIHHNIYWPMPPMRPFPIWADPCWW